MKLMSFQLLSYVIFLLLISKCYSKSCDIIENFRCDCHVHLNDYGQLTCETYKSISSIVIKKEIVQSRIYFNSYILTFRVDNLNISSQFISELSYLFPPLTSNSNNYLSQITPKDVSFIKISLIFSHFQQLHFQDYVFYELFDQTNQYQQQRQTTLNLEMSSNGQITMNPMAFYKLSVGQLIIHASSLGDYPFEYVFNNTNIGDLSIEGFTLKSNNTLKQSYNGHIKSAKFTKMAETLSSEEFPMIPVKSLTIEVHEPRKINSSTFRLYDNLNGLHIIQPRFNLDNTTFNGLQHLRNLETMVLDCETIKSDTFHHVQRLRFLTLGANLKILSDKSLNHLKHLERLDLSKILLDQLSVTSRCILAKFITNHIKSTPSLIVHPPQGEGCDCIYDYILTILNKNPSSYYMDNCKDSQQERCLLSECNVVQNFRPPLDISSPTSFLEKGQYNESSPFDYLRIIDGQLAESVGNEHEQSNEHQQSPPYYEPHKQKSPISGNGKSIYDSNSDSDTQVVILSSAEDRVVNAHSAMPLFLGDSSALNKLPESHSSTLLVVETTTLDPLIYISNPEQYNSKNNHSNNFRDEKLNINSKHSNLESQNHSDDNRHIALKNEKWKWIAISLAAVTILCLLIVITIIWFFTCRPRNPPSGFKLVPQSSTV